MRRLLALHPFFARGAVWSPLDRVLGTVELIAPDLPGHGDAPEGVEGDFMDAALARVMDVLPDAPVDVLGLSYGGALALRLLADHPERVRSLTVIEPVLFAAAAPEEMRRHWAEMDAFRAALAQGDRAGAAAVFTGLWGDGTDWNDLPEPVRTAIVRRVHLIPLTEPGLVEDVHGILPRLPGGVPVTIVTRRDPSGIVAAIRDGLATRLSRVRHRTLGSHHQAALRQPADLADILRENGI